MRRQMTVVLVPKRTLLAALAAVALLAAPVAGVEAKRDSPKASPDGGGGKKCEKRIRVGFTINGTFASWDDPDVTVDVRRANRHARRWLNQPNDPVFSTTDARVKFVGVTDNGGPVNFGDVVVTDRVKVRGKLSKPKKSCEGETTLKVKKIKVKRPDAA